MKVEIEDREKIKKIIKIYDQINKDFFNESVFDSGIFRYYSCQKIKKLEVSVLEEIVACNIYFDPKGVCSFSFSRNKNFKKYKNKVLNIIKNKKIYSKPLGKL